jgi:hypothetical protein
VFEDFSESALVLGRVDDISGAVERRLGLGQLEGPEAPAPQRRRAPVEVVAFEESFELHDIGERRPNWNTYRASS